MSDAAQGLQVKTSRRTDIRCKNVFHKMAQTIMQTYVHVTLACINAHTPTHTPC